MGAFSRKKRISARTLILRFILAYIDMKEIQTMIPKKEDRKDQQAGTKQKCSDIVPFTDKYFIQMEPIGLSAREFCRRVNRLSGLPIEEILEAEMQDQYRSRCIGLLARTLNISRQTVLNWGSRIDFPHMPKRYEKILGLYWAMHELHMEIKKLKRYINMY